MSKIIIDVDDALKRIQDDKELLVELIEIFLDDCPKKMKELKAFEQDKNAIGLSEVAHSIKGAAANISAVGLRKIFFEIEEMAKNNNFESISQRIKQASLEIKEIEEYFPNLKEQLNT